MEHFQEQLAHTEASDERPSSIEIGGVAAGVPPAAKDIEFRDESGDGGKVGGMKDKIMRGGGEADGQDGIEEIGEEVAEAVGDVLGRSQGATSLMGEKWKIAIF